MEGSRYEHRLRIRREVHGDDVVDAILASTDSFSQPMQDLLNEYCWGTVWSRDGLDRRSRSILNIGILAALNRPEAFAGHLRSALRNGVSLDRDSRVPSSGCGICRHAGGTHGVRGGAEASSRGRCAGLIRVRRRTVVTRASAVGSKHLSLD